MIQPVNAFSPKVFFRGEIVNDPKEPQKKETKKRLALANAAGISVVLGAATTAIARSNTSSWRHAGYFGIAAGLVSMMFLAPIFLYKSGINTTKKNNKDILVKEIEIPQKMVSDAADISNAAKISTKTMIKNMPKI